VTQADWTDDRILGGRVLLRQLRGGFRSGSDAVLLAAACHPPQGGRVLELGTASGSALLSLGWRRPDLDLTGLEIDPALSALATFNLGRNQMGCRGRILTSDIRAPLAEGEAFDLVLANPPYFTETRHRRSPDAARARARAEGEAKLADWVTAAVAALRPGGVAIFILRTERREDLLDALAAQTCGLTIRPIIGALHRPPKRMLVRVVPGGAGSVETLPALKLHHADGSETTLAGNLFRHAAPIFW